MKKLDLNVEMLEERIAPSVLNVAVPANAMGAGYAPDSVPEDVAPIDSAADFGAPVNAAASAANGAGGVVSVG